MNVVDTVIVTTNGVVIFPSEVTVTCGIGKGYNTATVKGLDVLRGGTKTMSGDVGDDLKITLNGEIFHFTIDERHISKEGQVVLDGIGTPAILGDAQPSDEAFSYVDSNELINSSKGSVTVQNQLPNIVFNGQTYDKTSTPLSRISDMVDVVKGEMYEISSVLHLVPKVGITTQPVTYTFVDNEKFEFSYSDKRASTAKTRSVLINPTSEDIYSTTKATLDFDETIGKGMITFNPSLTSNTPYTITGLQHNPPVQATLTEKVTLNDQASMIVNGGIDGVVYITADSQPLTPIVFDVNGNYLSGDYELYSPHNVIRFHSKMDAEIEVKYRTSVVKVTSNTSTPFTVRYGCAEISDNVTIDTEVSNGACRVVIGSEPAPTYENGAEIFLTKDVDATIVFIESKGSSHLVTQKTYPNIGGGLGTLTVKYLYTSTDWTNKGFMDNIASSTITRTNTSNGEIVLNTDLDKYIVYLDEQITSINDIYYGNQIISGYTYVSDPVAPYITFNASDVDKDVTISYEVERVKLSIPAPSTGHPVTLIDVIACDGITSGEFSNNGDLLCSLPATFLINVAESFNMEVDQVKGKTLDGAFGSLVVNSAGNVEVTVSTQDEHIITCDSIYAGATITVNSKGVPS